MERLRPYLNKYKSQIIFASLLLAAICIIFWVLLPQLATIGSLNQDIEDVSHKLEITKRSVQALSSLSEQTVEDNLSMVTSALPPEKDISGIYTALVGTAGRAGVAFDGFSLQVGGVYSKKKITEAVTSAGTSSPSLQVSARFGNVNQKTFGALAHELAYAFPLSEILSVGVHNGDGNVSINFFYKPYNLAYIGNQETIPQVTAQEQTILTALESFNH